MSRFPITRAEGQIPLKERRWLPMYSSRNGMFYDVTITQVYEVHPNPDGTITYRVDAQCQLMSRNDQEMCEDLVYHYEGKTWCEMEVLKKRQLEEMVALP